MSCSIIMTIIGAIITTGLGGAVGYLSARRISILNTKAVACAKLRAGFAPVLATIAIEQRSGRDTHETFNNVPRYARESLISVAGAIEECRPFAGNSVGYEEAWQHYCQLATEDAQAFMESNAAGLPYWGSIERAIQNVLRCAQ